MQMRSLTVAERGALYSEHRCPFCRGDKFFEGPHGGLSVNWFCARCGAGFNLGPAEYSEFGQLISEPGPSPDRFQRNNSDAVALHLPAYVSHLQSEDAMQLRMEQVPPPKEVPVQEIAETLGLIAGLRAERSKKGGWRCGVCRAYQKDNDWQVWVPDGVYMGDPPDVVSDICRRNAFNGHFSAWCLPCAEKLHKRMLNGGSSGKKAVNKKAALQATISTLMLALIVLGFATAPAKVLLWIWSVTVAGVFWFIFYKMFSTR